MDNRRTYVTCKGENRFTKLRRNIEVGDRTANYI